MTAAHGVVVDFLFRDEAIPRVFFILQKEYPFIEHMMKRKRELSREKTQREGNCGKFSQFNVFLFFFLLFWSLYAFSGYSFISASSVVSRSRTTNGFSLKKKKKIFLVRVVFLFVFFLFRNIVSKQKKKFWKIAFSPGKNSVFIGSLVL